MSNVEPSCSRRTCILLVDDDLGDQELTRRALRSGELPIDLQVVSDGEEALEYLFRRNAFSDPQSSPVPDLILLDLNMPRVNGREVLERLKSDDELSRIPIVVLTTSQQEVDILRSYDLGCNSYIQKPVDINQFKETVRQLGHYWFNVVTLPATPAEA